MSLSALECSMFFMVKYLALLDHLEDYSFIFTYFYHILPKDKRKSEEYIHLSQVFSTNRGKTEGLRQITAPV